MALEERTWNSQSNSTFALASSHTVPAQQNDRKLCGRVDTVMPAGLVVWIVVGLGCARRTYDYTNYLSVVFGSFPSKTDVSIGKESRKKSAAGSIIWVGPLPNGSGESVLATCNR